MTKKRCLAFTRRLSMRLSVFHKLTPCTARYLSFHHMTQCATHASKGLACRTPVLLTHAEVTKNLMFYSMDPPAFKLTRKLQQTHQSSSCVKYLSHHNCVIHEFRTAKCSSRCFFSGGFFAFEKCSRGWLAALVHTHDSAWS